MHSLSCIRPHPLRAQVVPAAAASDTRSAGRASADEPEVSRTAVNGSAFESPVPASAQPVCGVITPLLLLAPSSAHPVPARADLRPSLLCSMQPPPTVAPLTSTSARPMSALRNLRPTLAQPPPTVAPRTSTSAHPISALRNLRPTSAQPPRNLRPACSHLRAADSTGQTFRPSHLCSAQPPPTVAPLLPTSARPISAQRNLRPTSAHTVPTCALPTAQPNLRPSRACSFPTPRSPRNLRPP